MRIPQALPRWRQSGNDWRSKLKKNYQLLTNIEFLNVEATLSAIITNGTSKPLPYIHKMFIGISINQRNPPLCKHQREPYLLWWIFFFKRGCIIKPLLSQRIANLRWIWNFHDSNAIRQSQTKSLLNFSFPTIINCYSSVIIDFTNVAIDSIAETFQSLKSGSKDF